MKNGGSKVTVEKGQVVKITKDKKGVVKREVLTKSMAGLDRLLGRRFRLREPARKSCVIEADADGELHEREVWTGNYIFENEWQASAPGRTERLS